MADDLSVDAVGRHLCTRALGRHLHWFEETTSTSTIAMNLGHEGAPHGTVVLADAQTKGRGRMGRSWVSPPGKNLYLSILLRPDLPPTRAPELTLLAAVAVHETLDALGVRPAVKWPNDIEVNGKKTVGILCEMSAELSGLRYVVIGIGIDVNMAVEDFPPEIASIATSLECALGRKLDRSEILASLLSNFERWLDVHAREGFEPVRRRWSECTNLFGTRVRARMTQGDLVGVVEGLDTDGALLLRDDRGAIERVVVGDVERLSA